MSIEHREPEPLSRAEVDKTANGSLATATQIAVETARRAADHAVMAIFELALLHREASLRGDWSAGVLTW
jgi:hypothetical protein